MSADEIGFVQSSVLEALEILKPPDFVAGTDWNAEKAWRMVEELGDLYRALEAAASGQAGTTVRRWSGEGSKRTKEEGDSHATVTSSLKELDLLLESAQVVMHARSDASHHARTDSGALKRRR